MWAKLRRSPVGLAGAIILTVVVLVALTAPLLAPYDPNLKDPTLRLKPPIWLAGSVKGHVLGTDTLGRDILSRVLYGARVSTLVGTAAVAVAGTIGVTLGLVTGFFGGLLDTAMMRFTDAFQAIPGLLLTMLVVGITGPGLWTLIFVLGFTTWVTYARVVRGETLTVREREYVAAARALGQVDLWIVLRHVLPNVRGSVIVLATLNVASVILAESGLSFLGLGVPPTTPTWGGILADGRNYITHAWWVATFPGIAISLTVLGITFLGDWLRDYFDPRLRRN